MPILNEKIRILKLLISKLENSHYFKPQELYVPFQKEFKMSQREFFNLLRKTGCRKHTRNNRVWRRPQKDWDLVLMFKKILLPEMQNR